jgi:hypothetical protein
VAKKEYWKAEPDPHDFPAAGNYLALLLPEAHVAAVVRKLRAAPISHKKAKNLLRASRLQLLPADDPDVARDLEKIGKGKLLAPVLLLRGHAPSDVAMTIADGYHRICASYHVDEDAEIPCRIVDAPPA